MIRLEWAADKHFEDHASLVFINRRMPVPRFTQHHSKSRVVLDTSALHLDYHPASGSDGRFAPENLTITLKFEGNSIQWHPGMEDTKNLLGTTRTLDGARGSVLKSPMEQGLLSRAGWTLVDDSDRNLFDSTNFEFKQGEKSPWPWVMPRAAGERQDWYFFGYGHNYKQALQDYVQVAGRIPLPPRFAFGAWWSRYWAYSDRELDNLVSGFRNNDVPLDVLVIDMDWHLNKAQLEAKHETDQSENNLGWSGYTWNPLLFPDPKEFLGHLQEEGLKATLNLHPASGVQPFEKPYPEMARAMGIDPATKRYVPFDITDKKYAQNYMDLLHHPLEKQGIDFWWLDWQQEKTTKVAGLNPTWWLNYVHFTDQEREGRRPLLFHRWGGLGNHRYQIGFSGDTVSVWDSLAFQPWFTATAANVGYAYWSHDIGGHMPGAVDPELYTRWIQFGVFSPILRTHTTKNASAERRIWAYPEPYSDIMKSAFHLRYAMEPYLYTEARHTYDSGVAFLHPLYYEWPEENAAYESKSEYMFGSQMIVAPVVTSADPKTQLAVVKLWIPEGDWIERWTGKHFHGPMEVQRSYSIDQIPVFVRAGAIIPMQPPMQYTGQKPVDPLLIEAYAPASDKASTYTLYEDDGHAEDYKNDVAAWTTIDTQQDQGDLVVHIDPVKGSYPGMPEQRSYQLRLPASWPPDSVTVGNTKLDFVGRNENATGWRFEGQTMTTVIRTPEFSVHQAVEIRLHHSAASVNHSAIQNGFAGSLQRLQMAYDELNNLYPIAAPPDPLILASQTGDRLTYHPENAAEELAAFKQRYADAMQSVESLSATVKSMKAPEEGEDARTKALEQIQRVELQLQDGRP
ncbi:glycoside hydrolase family 31 protein [Silvibacterium acidisoli]|uniref:glycoside hydrolase family 31 protein n=1 Tax=Acidobacteriaceae bacterium ZG23-2 TaxID=2883246 RepID=UPI00406CA231